jgi:hypothetical protein
MDGTRGAFERADRGVGVQGDDEGVSEGAGLAEIADVADVEEIEDAVGEDELLALRMKRRSEGADFFDGGEPGGGGGHG